MGQDAWICLSYDEQTILIKNRIWEGNNFEEYQVSGIVMHSREVCKWYESRGMKAVMKMFATPFGLYRKRRSSRS